ncbi:hypothetical protein [Nitrosopumilus sp.]|nr:hypothetical protein [Nitrosopumilus sp.]
MKKQDSHDKENLDDDNQDEENLAMKKNDDWWRLEKFQIGRSRFS